MERKEKLQFFIENIHGVGPAKAEKIVDLLTNMNSPLEIAHNKEVFEKLKENCGIKLANSIMDQIADMKRQDDAVQTMVDCGIPYLLATDIAKTELTFDAFKKDPYRIGYQMGLRFELCDKFAHIQFQEGVAPDMSKSRMQYFINAMLMELENSGHTFAYLPQLTKKLNLYQKRHEYLPENYEDSTIILYLHNNDLVEVEKHNKIKKWKIYRKQIAELENDIAYHIKRLSINKSEFNDVEFESDGLEYDDVQLEAIKSASLCGLKILTGPPGSGKTAVINGIIKYFEKIKNDAKIILCAPTGRAAKHMTEITGRNSSTIHKLLGLGETQFFVKKTKLDCDALICDEASMLNLDVTFELLSRIKTGTVIYFVGDKDQLPAVGPGNVLHDIIRSGIVPVYELTKVYRQDGIILENAHQINQGVVPTATSNQYSVQTYTDANTLKRDALRWFEQMYNENEPFETQILIPSYKTECGITALNLAIQNLNPENYIYRSSTHQCAYKKNDKVLMTKNDKNGKYQNGSIGIFIANMTDEIVVQFDGEEVYLPKTAIEDMTLGYATSVHKAQGSEYKNVLICLPEKPVNMLKRKILYTAVTRAKNNVTLMEMTGAIKQCVETNSEMFMQTGLREKIISCSVR